MDQGVQPAPRRRSATTPHGCRSSATSGSSVRSTTELAGLKLVHGKSKTPRKLDRHWGDDEPTADGGDSPGLDPRRVGRHRGEGPRRPPPPPATTARSCSCCCPRSTPRRSATRSRATPPPPTRSASGPSRRPTRAARPSRACSRGSCEGERAARTSSSARSIAKAQRVPGRRQRADHQLAARRRRDRRQPRARPPVPEVHGCRRPGVEQGHHQGARRRPRRAGSRSAGQGEVPANPVCKEVLARISGAGTKGSDLQRDLGEPPFGWPKDAIDGAAPRPAGQRQHPRRPQTATGRRARRSFPPPRSARPSSTRRTSRRARPSTRRPRPAHRGGCRTRPARRAQPSAGCFSTSSTSHTRGRTGAPAGATDTEHLAAWQRSPATNSSARSRPPRSRFWRSGRLDEAGRAPRCARDGLGEARPAAGPRRRHRRGRRRPDPAPGDPREPPAARRPRPDRAAHRHARRRPPGRRRGRRAGGPVRARGAITGARGVRRVAELDPAARDPLLAEAGLDPIRPQPMATDDELLQALDSVSLSSWRERRQALPRRPPRCAPRRRSSSSRRASR